MEKNRVNIEAFDQTIAEGEKDLSSALKTLKVEGIWRLGVKGPQFESELKYENGRVILYSDEPAFLGGGGTSVNPIQYCLFGVASCFAATFAKWAAKEGVVLEELTVTAVAHLDMSRSFGLTENPIMDKMTLNISTKTDASDEDVDRIRQLTIERCPAYYCLTEPVTPEVVVSKL
ncbi:MAG: OsmC family protein [Candidatus Thorarchaeota archaeon]|nr:OsmC family protein [Candidatus Thorarchaeota archaeon]MCK5239388.1 OsmC family protein [Candidatus Thorarchaeota archaeon]